MADIKTNLRELSVAYYFFNDIDSLKNINPSSFLNVCNNNVENCNLQLWQIAYDKNKFSNEELQIIFNGYNLGEKIRKLFSINQNPKIYWLGTETQSGVTIDLIIENYKFSLKEDSFILENMGLYKLLNTITGKEKFKRGLHVFKDFSPDEFKNWYEITKKLLIEYGPYKFFPKNNDHTIYGELYNDKLILCYENEIHIINNFKRSTYNDFIKNTKAKTREKIFSKWIKMYIENSADYIKYKKKCAEAAGEKIKEFLSPYIGSHPISLQRFFRLEDFTYYYAKSTNNILEIYKVPRLSQDHYLIVENINYSIPTSQLNIKTQIKNKLNDRKITFRNECRYSHGQFNGTPEAKCYIDDGNLKTMYECLYHS